MDREDIIELANKAHAYIDRHFLVASSTGIASFEHFARLVAEREREAVLDTIDELMGMEHARHPVFSEGYDHALLHLKEFVSARGKK
jgi:hypothetical protein